MWAEILTTGLLASLLTTGVTKYLDLRRERQAQKFQLEKFYFEKKLTAFEALTQFTARATTIFSTYRVLSEIASRSPAAAVAAFPDLVATMNQQGQALLTAINQAPVTHFLYQEGMPDLTLYSKFGPLLEDLMRFEGLMRQRMAMGEKYDVAVKEQAAKLNTDIGELLTMMFEALNKASKDCKPDS